MESNFASGEIAKVRERTYSICMHLINPDITLDHVNCKLLLKDSTECI